MFFFSPNQQLNEISAMSIELSDFAIGSNMPNVTLTSALKHFISHKFCSILPRINGFKIEFDAHETHKTSIQ